MAHRILFATALGMACAGAALAQDGAMRDPDAGLTGRPYQEPPAPGGGPSDFEPDYEGGQTSGDGAPPAAGGDASICTSGLSLGRNPNCPGGNSAFLVNSCARPIDARICIFTTRGAWDCGVNWGVQPGESWSYPSCFGTDEVFSSVRYSDQDIPLDAPD